MKKSLAFIFAAVTAFAFTGCLSTSSIFDWDDEELSDYYYQQIKSGTTEKLAEKQKSATTISLAGTTYQEGEDYGDFIRWASESYIVTFLNETDCLYSVALEPPVAVFPGTYKVDWKKKTVTLSLSGRAYYSADLDWEYEYETPPEPFDMTLRISDDGSMLKFTDGNQIELLKYTEDEE